MVRSLTPIDLVIVGSTASGKSQLALEWSQRFGAEIISADSRQVYREISIGTGKPSQNDLEKVPHHLLNLCSIDQTFSAGDFVRFSRAAIEKIQKKGLRVVVCGGTGLYLKALLGGLVELPYRSPDHYSTYRKRQEECATPSLYARLVELDSMRAASVHPHDRVRILRALYLFEEFSAPPSELYETNRGESITANRILGLDPGREVLNRQISARVHQMLANGWVNEVVELVRRGFPPESPGFNSLGYREILDCLEGRASWCDLENNIVLKTLQYAKRQRTWFRHMSGVEWVDPNDCEHSFLETDPNYATIKTISHQDI